MATYRIGPFELRSARLTLTRNGGRVPVGQKVVETLLALIERSGAAVAKAVLVERIWPHAAIEESNLAQNVYVIRKIFRDHGWDNPIETLPGLGYRLTMPVELITPPQTRSARSSRIVRFWPLVAACAALLAFRLVVAHHNAYSPHPTPLSQGSARLYAIGRYYWNLRTADGVSKSMTYFAAIIARDPGNSLGYVGMADAYATMGDYCYGTHRPARYFARAQAYAREALLLDPGSAPAHATLGFVLMHQHSANAAMAELRRSIAGDASYAPAHEWYGILLARAGRAKAARSELELASTLEPLSVATTAWLKELADHEGRPAEASLYAREVREMVASFGNRRPPSRHPTWAAIEAVAAAAIAP